ncbi:MAG: Gfo/Idh/MocA family oxidoreductase, partial [Mariniphaga sp.]|nr:Gfo/Idh/MocA family oxidoreductase [Mariniphaga sp.]
MTKIIKTALASYGMSGQVFHGPLLKGNSGFEVTAVLERHKSLSRRLFPEATIHRNYAELLGLPDTELIVVNTPDNLHYEMARQALEAGKHVVLEKPAAQKRAEAEELFNLAEKKGLTLTVFQNRRWDNDFLTVKKILEQNYLGRIIEMESHFDRYRNYITPDTWKEEGDEYTGVLYNIGSHTIDQVYLLFGRPKAVTAHLRIVRTGGIVNDYYDIRLDYEKFSAIVKCSYLVKKPGPRFTIHGTSGTFQKWGIDPQEELLKTGMLPVGPNWGREPENKWGILSFEKEGL